MCRMVVCWARWIAFSLRTCSVISIPWLSSPAMVPSSPVMGAAEKFQMVCSIWPLRMNISSTFELEKPMPVAMAWWNCGATCSQALPHTSATGLPRAAGWRSASEGT